MWGAIQARGIEPAPDRWSAQATMSAAPDQVLAALTDPALIADWAPVAFELGEDGGGRLRRGACERVSGSIAGVRASFQVEVLRADPNALELVARGPVAMDVAYRFRERRGRVLVDASVRLRKGRGMTAALLRAAVVALLNAGALDRALARLASSFCERAELVAA